VDVETNVPGDMFNQMRSVLGLQRTTATAQGKAPLSPKEVLAFCTIEGARANGLDSKTGSLTPGKQADVVMLRTDRMNVTPLNEPATAVVVGMDTGNVDTVLIAGRVMKRHGKLLYVDWPAVRRMAAESRDQVLARSGFKVPSI
jgi:cytosine/adenosine deaminase-related metal-dependent hydrolase